MKKLGRFLPHLSLCLSLCLLVFLVLDGYNPNEGWLNGTVAKVYIVLCCLAAIVTALLLIARQRRRKPRKKDPPQDQM